MAGNPFGDVELTDPTAMRALAHPVRLAILDQLRSRGPSTASELAPHVGATPSVTSWHLRHLAGFGLVRDGAPSPDRRQRRWEVVARGFRFAQPADPDDHGAAAAARALSAQMFRQYADVPDRWSADVEPTLTAQWRRHAGLSNTRIVVSAQELEHLGAAIEALLAPFVTRAEDERPDGARGVRLLRYVLPES